MQKDFIEKLLDVLNVSTEMKFSYDLELNIMMIGLSTIISDKIIDYLKENDIQILKSIKLNDGVIILLKHPFTRMYNSSNTTYEAKEKNYFFSPTSHLNINKIDKIGCYYIIKQNSFQPVVDIGKTLIDTGTKLCKKFGPSVIDFCANYLKNSISNVPEKNDDKKVIISYGGVELKIG